MPRVVHFEIQADNPERAVKFYTETFGWQIQKWDGPMDYWLITTGPSDQPGIDGGLMKRQGPPPVENQAVNAYVCTIEVDSVDDYLAKAQSNGATVVVPKSAIPGIGWIAYIKDTEGNIVGLYRSDRAAS